ncbi:MAG: bifunctional adenosylcobinamide kinase/adenosylcobinamide-phosphate guanylyltransferase [Muribaculaceae bacterium]|nr:bifunctional adenosylcobinamide kinase/adenosylcobinamide-phosphate guanylyltransferase [Muribaculaceae bacterium]
MGKSRVIYITGGQRSGKSVFAEQFVRNLSSNPIYLATANVWDEEMEKRVQKHRLRRGKEWQTVEAPLCFDTDFSGRTVLLDCLTMFATNHFFKEDENVEKSLNKIKAELEKLFSQEDSNFIIVSNEIGLGGVSTNKTQRKFSDLQGMINQYVAQKSDEAYMILSGLPIRLK